MGCSSALFKVIMCFQEIHVIGVCEEGSRGMTEVPGVLNLAIFLPRLQQAFRHSLP